MRSYARETAFCKIYQYIVSGEEDGDFSQFDADKLTDEDIEFAKNLVALAVGHKEELDAEIAELSRAYKLSRIYRADLAALELAIAEMKYSDTPHPVVINEAVGIAKKYSTDKSVSYVNGILAAFERNCK